MTVNKAIRHLLFTFNFLFFVGGFILFGLSVYVRNNKADYHITDDLLPALNLMIFIGAVTMIFGFLGFYGAIRKNRCLLTLFFLGLLAMFLMLLAVGALGAVSRTAAAQEVARKHLKRLVPLSEQPKEVQESFQKVEISGFCCGFFAGHLDWGNSTVVPDSCNCTDTSRNCADLDGRQIYSTPCMTYFMTWLDRVSDTLMGAAFGFGILMIVGMAFSLILICQIRNKKSMI